MFAILILLRRAIYILQFLESTEYSDARLPFQKAADLPEGNEQDFYKLFDKNQWPFCAQELGPNSLLDKRFDQKMIVPITSSKLLKDGPDGSTLKVEIHPDYNRFHPDVSKLTYLGMSKTVCG